MRVPFEAGTRPAQFAWRRLLVVALGLAGAGPARAADPAPVADPESAREHLEQALRYTEAGDYAGANLEFETVLRLEDLPASIHQKSEIYAEAAKEYLAGGRFLPSGYALLGLGNYRENSTPAGGGEANDRFFSARVGGRANYLFSDEYAFNGSLDYRFRDYDDRDRRNDSDLRWNGAVSRSLDESNISAGLRGRVSYRGDDDYRNDFGLYGDWRLLSNTDDQYEFGAEFRRRQYPSGPLRDRTHNIAELSASWTRSLTDGKASFTLAGFGGREFASQRTDGDSNFFGLSPTFEFTLGRKWSGLVFAWWQNDRYNVERLGDAAGDDVLFLPTRNDNLYELGGGLTFEFGDSWSLNPEVLYIRDQSNVLGENYSSFEIWLTIRNDF